MSHADCMLRYVLDLKRVGVESRTAAAPDHECDWWEPHTCSDHFEPFYSHPTQAKYDSWRGIGIVDADHPVGR